MWQLVLLIFAQLASEFALDNVGGGQDVERRVFGLDGLVWHGNDHLYLIFIAMFAIDLLDAHHSTHGLASVARHHAVERTDLLADVFFGWLVWRVFANTGNVDVCDHADPFRVSNLCL